MAIHQPRSEIFVMLDHVVLLCNGTMVFSGQPGSDVAAFIAEVAADEIESLDRTEPVSPRTRVEANPADALLDAVAREDSASYQRAIDRADDVRSAAEARLRLALEQAKRPPIGRPRTVSVRSVLVSLMYIQLRCAYPRQSH